MNTGPVVIDTPEGMAYFRLLQVRGALSIEVKTGKSHSRGSVLKLAQREYGIKSRTKKGALAELNALVVEAGGEAL